MKAYTAEEFHERIIQKCNGGFALNGYDLAYLEEWNEKVSQFHDYRLEMVKMKEFHFLNYIQNILKEHLAENPILGSNPNVIKQLEEINTQYNTWINLGSTFSENTDQKARGGRTYAWNNYFKAVPALLTLLKFKLNITQPMFPSWDILLDFFTDTFLKNNYSDIKSNPTPFTKKLAECSKRWAQHEGIRIQVEGKENLGLIPSECTQTPRVNLFVPSHRYPTPDILLLGDLIEHLGLPHCIIFGNPKMFANIPDLFKRQIAFLPDFIPVGDIKDMDPNKKISMSLNRSPNFILYLQGFTSNIGDIQRISKQSVNKLIAVLLTMVFDDPFPKYFEGCEVNIYPIAYESESEFSFNKPNHRDVLYKIKFGKPLKYGAVQTLTKLQLGSIPLRKENYLALLNGKISGNGPRYIDNYLLTYWWENIIDHAELELKQLVERTKEKLGLYSKEGAKLLYSMKTIPGMDNRQNQILHIYLLGLESGKYYVGKTSNPSTHNLLENVQSNWTSIYKPNKIIEIISNCNDNDLDKYTLRYMNKYGIGNVRGGSHLEVILSEEKLNIIDRILNKANIPKLIGKCSICQDLNHYAKDCPNLPKQCIKCKLYGHGIENCPKTLVDNKGLPI
jgi:hypothetical protein